LVVGGYIVGWSVGVGIRCWFLVTGWGLRLGVPGAVCLRVSAWWGWGVVYHALEVRLVSFSVLAQPIAKDSSRTFCGTTGIEGCNGRGQG